MAIEVLGIGKLLTDIKGLENTARLKPAMVKATGIVHASAKVLCPVDTGNLRNSIAMEVKQEGYEITGKVSTNMEYAAFVEFGTGVRGHSTNKNKEVSISYGPNQGQVAQPYLYPALKRNSNRIRQLIKEAL